MTTEEIDYIESEIAKAKALQALSKDDQIAQLCDEHGCDEKMKRVHRRMYVFETWNPHPSDRFKRWWNGTGYREVEDATGHGWSTVNDKGDTWPVWHVTAYNCEEVRNVYRQFLAIQRAELRRMKRGGDDDEVIPF